MNTNAKPEITHSRTPIRTIARLALSLALLLPGILVAQDVHAKQLLSGQRASVKNERLGVRIVGSGGEVRVVVRAAGKRVKVNAGERVSLLGTDVKAVTFKRVGEDLSINTADGDQVTLAGFYGYVPDSMSPPSLELKSRAVTREAALKIISSSGQHQVVHHRPGVAIPVSAGDQVILVNRDVDRATMKREGYDLRIITVEGDDILLRGYFANS